MNGTLEKALGVLACDLFGLIRGACIGSIVFFISIEVRAAGEAWPIEGHSRLPLLRVISPDRPQSFSYSAGVVSKWNDPSWYKGLDRESFQYLSLNSEWEKPKFCQSVPRSHGYIQSHVLTLDRGESLQFVIPIEFNFKGNYSASDLDRIRYWPILKISIIKLMKSKATKGQKYSVREQEFMVGELEHSPFNSAEHGVEDKISVAFKNLLQTSTFHFKKKSNVRIRIEWAADSICGETTFQLKIGDQIRIYRNEHN